MDMMMSVPLIPPSTLAPHTLETIPGSTNITPPRRSVLSTPTEIPANFMFDGTNNPCEAGPSRPTPQLSRKASLVSHIAPESYFEISRARSSPATTPYGDRPRPTMLEIPLGTPEDPLFSNYPSTVPSRVPSYTGKARAGVIPLATAFQFQLEQPVARRRRGRTRQGDEEDDEKENADSSGSSSPTLGWWNKKNIGRRRAFTITSPTPSSPSSPAIPDVEHVDASFKTRPELDRGSSSYNRRRASLGSLPHGQEFVSNITAPEHMPWSDLHPAAILAQAQRVYAYPQPGLSKPSSPTSPQITPRRSSLIGMTPLDSDSLGLTFQPKHRPLSGVSSSRPESIEDIRILIPVDESIPHEPPPRRSSLSFGPDTIMEIKSMARDDLPSPTSLLSASLSTTEESGSADFFSPTSSDAHPLSSATTSLSRSAKSAKEGGMEGEDAAKDAALTALRLQRSLEWEAKHTRHRRKLEKRRMILLEFVETEVAYAEDLKALVEVYLPQLHALPSVQERTAVAVGRNSAELLVIHSELSRRMVDILKKEGLGYEMLPEEDLAGKVEMVSRKLASVLVDQTSSFSAYNEYCAGSIAASSLVRNISLRTDYIAFERRCQIISSANPPARLQDLLDASFVIPTSTNKSRLHFKDYLIMPIQRVCRYPLLLASLLGAADTPSSSGERPPYFDQSGRHDEYEYDVGVDIERALGAMRGVAEEADNARRQKESEIKTATILARIEPHQVITPTFIGSLGPVRLVGSLDVLHHHPTIAPLVPPIKVKYLAAFLYRGYLVLAKVKKGKMYEAKHFLPLEVFEMIDLTEGFLPHSIRLSLREHSFDLAASCEAEKDVWSAALISARDESIIPPFELPASVSPFAARSRRMSNVGTLMELTPIETSPPTPNKRHTLGSLPLATPTPEASPNVYLRQNIPLDSPVVDIESVGTPATKTPSTPFVAIGLAGQAPIVLRRATPNQRLAVDRELIDVFSENCAQARSKAQLHHALFLPDTSRQSQEVRDRLSMRESTMLRRRRSFLDSTRQRQRTSSADIAFSGEVKGSVIPVRPTRSLAGSNRNSTISNNGTQGPVRPRIRPRRASLTGSMKGTEESATEMDGADDTATSDFGTLRGYSYNDSAGRSRRRNIHASPNVSPLKSLNTFRPGLEPITSAVKVPTTSTMPISPLTSTFISASQAPTRFASLRKSVRRSASVINLYQRPTTPTRAMSTPSSPMLRAQEEENGKGKSRQSDVDDIKLSSSDPHRHASIRSNRHSMFGLGSRHTSDLEEVSSSAPLPPPKDRPRFQVGAGNDTSEDGDISTSGDGDKSQSEGGQGELEKELPTLEASTQPQPPVSPTRVRHPSLQMTPRPSIDTANIVYTLGNGLTNTPEKIRPWGTLKRTLTSRSQRSSVLNFDDLSQVANGSGSPTLTPQTLSAQPTPSHSRSSSFGYESLNFSPSESGVLVGAGSQKEQEVVSGVEPRRPPRRSRSLRLLQSLKSFTAM